MPYMPTNHSDVPIRLFKSDFLEAFTHIHPGVVLLIWLPIALWHLSRPIVASSLTVVQIVVAFVVGVVVWTFTEYTMHRFVFHFEPKTNHPTVERLIFLFHGIHHVHPGLHWSLTPAAHEKELHPHIHPALEQKSLFIYLVKTFLFPGRRVRYDGDPVVLPPAAKDEEWIPKSIHAAISDLGAEGTAMDAGE